MRPAGPYRLRCFLGCERRSAPLARVGRPAAPRQARAAGPARDVIFGGGNAGKCIGIHNPISAYESAKKDKVLVPGTQKEIAERLGLTPPTVNYHVGILSEHRAIRVERAGRKTHCFVADAGAPTGGSTPSGGSGTPGPSAPRPPP